MDINKVPNFNELENIFNPIDEILPMRVVVEKIKKERKGQKDIFPIGFSTFNQIMNGGIRGGDLVVISGRSGEGKTTFAQTLTWHLNKLGLPQLWFSYEMDIEEIWKKFEAMGIDEEFMSYCPLKIQSGMIEWIETKVNEAILKFNIKTVFIDHLGFLLPKNDKFTEMSRNYSAYLGMITRQLKDLARNNNITIFLLSHVRKTREELTLDDLAFSSGIGQEADFVFAISRGREKKDRWGKSEGDVFTNETKVAMIKNRRTGNNKFIKCLLTNGKFTPLQEEISID